MSTSTATTASVTGSTASAAYNENVSQTSSRHSN
jgi:hypothetical protein